MIRIGHNPNTNMLPLFHFLPKEHPLLTLVTAEPTGHNAMLADGRIDLAPISVFSYAVHWQDYAILPNLSVSNEGRVGSILLFSKVALEELDGRTVALTDTSATSVNLTKVLLHHYYGVRPSYLTMPSDLERMFAKADGALLIADAAIKADLAKPDCYVYDLGEEWLRHTGYSMTYAVWAFPRKLIAEQGDEIKAVYQLLLEGKDKAMINREEILKACKKMVGGSLNFWRDYFSRFIYDLDEKTTLGLKKYLDLCYAENLLSSRPLLQLWPEV